MISWSLLHGVLQLDIITVICLPIPVIPAGDSGGSRPPVPTEVGHPNRSKAATYRSEATLAFNKSQIMCFESNQIFFAHRFSFQIDSVRVVNQAIQDGISQGGIADNFMPVIYGQLTGNQR